MLDLNGSPRLIFEHGFNDQDAYEAEGRGYLSHVTVDLGAGRQYPVVFYDAVRLRQDIDEEAKVGTPYVAAPGMIVLAKVTVENMQRAVADLSRGDFFSRLVPQPHDSCAAVEQ
jgi:hypothetical protein